MRLKLPQKIAALAAAPSLHRHIAQRLIRQYWQQRPRWELNFHGVSAMFATDDFYSNYWFYGPQNIENAYEPSITRLTIDLAKKSRCFADIGANLGYFAVVAAKANPALRVVAIELDETLAPIISKNLEINHLSNVEIKSGAVGDGNVVVIHEPHAYSFLSAAAGEAIAMPRVDLKTKSFRLDDFFRDMGSLPDFVKMDVDGAELVALENAHEVLANPDLTMLLEVQTVSTPEIAATAADVGKLLSSYGLSLYSISAAANCADSAKLQQVFDLNMLPQSRPTAMILVTRRPQSFFDD